MNGLIVHNMQENPAGVIVFALGLCGNEASAYAQDILRSVTKDIIVITVEGVEGGDDLQHRFFLKNDTSRIRQAAALGRKLLLNTSNFGLLGLGASLGGALILQASECFDSILMISTSIWYEHAIKTMRRSLKGRIANRILVYCQFIRLWTNKNHLHHKCTFKEWLKLCFASSMLEQDKILCQHYGIDYDTYIQSLDLRKKLAQTKRAYFLVSSNDPMFSHEHLLETKSALANCPHVKSIITDIGSHGEFTVRTRNDYLLKVVDTFIMHARGTLHLQ